MHEHPNSLLKVGCLLFIVGGLASALVTLAGLLLSVGSMMDSELYPYVDQMARAQSDGLIGGDEIMAVFSGPGWLPPTVLLPWSAALQPPFCLSLGAFSRTKPITKHTHPRPDGIYVYHTYP